jgi:Transglycosylase-like domain
MPDQGGISGKVLGVAFAGGILFWSGVKGKAFSAALRDIIAGKNPASAASTPITDPSSATTTVQQSANQAATTGPGVGTPDAANEAVVRSVAATYGWATGQEWTDLVNIIMAESGFSNIAQNPGSTAYGIFQFLDTTWASVGGVKTSNALLQATYGCKYIKERYGDPIKAWAFHLANGYY